GTAKAVMSAAGRSRRSMVVVLGGWLAALAGAASVRGDRDVAAERLGGNSRRAASDLEAKALGRRATNSVFTRLEGDGKLAIHTAIPGGHRDLRRRIARDVQPDV